MPPQFMSLSSPPSSCDIFCRVIDNYGDIGVCWRLARQLAWEHGWAVRLWVDDLGAFARICPLIDRLALRQTIDGIDIHRWNENSQAFEATVPGDIVIEAFACHLPESFVEAMARRQTPPVWINLDYLSAEDWVGGCHTLPSPHPRLPLVKYFFFPGFDATTGGLLRENDLEERRVRFLESAHEQLVFWQMLGGLPPENTFRISLFAYENPALPVLLARLAQSDKPACCLAPLTRTQADIETFLGHPVQIGEIYRRGQLEIRPLPFVAQADYDHLLWLCDVNFVRGEDSFVRAQWAAKPMVWQIYPQDENAHLIKLDAFLERYSTGLSIEAATCQHRFHLAWNGFETLTDRCVDDWLACQPEFHRHAREWQKNLLKQQDLCAALVRFCQSKAIMRG